MKSKIIFKTLIITLICLSVNLSAVFAQTTGFPTVREAIECSVRGGLPHFFKKIKQREGIKLAYLGGSITEQEGWRVKSLDYFKKTYPNCKFSVINAAIGGTGSNLGVLRIEHDVLSQNPDLLFVEFAVNDSRFEPIEIVKSVEGIVRKTWKLCPQCDNCFVYTFADLPLFDSLKVGKLNQSAAVMEVIADYYGIPSIHLGLEAIRLLK